MKKLNYFNAWDIVSDIPAFMYMFIGGRGIGKTYSTLAGVIQDHQFFMYVRRTEIELKNCCTPVLNPFQAINTDFGTNIRLKANADSYAILDNDDIIGVAGAVSTFGKYRGADFQQVKYIIFDEFIPSGTRNTIKDESSLLFNMIETVNRNRELSGGDPIKIIMLSNANTIDCDIIRTLKLGDVIHRMKTKDIEIYHDTERGLYLQLLKQGQISKLKSQTALYKLTAGTDFYKMSIDNEFTTDRFDDVKKIPPQKLTPVCCINNLFIYSIKDSNKLFISYRKSDVDDKYTDETLTAFKRDYGILLDYYITTDNVLYYNYDVKLEFLNLFK